MAELSTLGRAALYDHMVEALASHGTGRLDKDSLLQSTDVSDDDLRSMITIVCETGEYPKRDVASQDRVALVNTLADLIEHVSLMPGLTDQSAEPTLRGSRSGDDDPTLLQFQTPRMHAIAQGQSGNVTRRVLHATRVAAGWKSHTGLGGNSIAGKKVLQTIIEAYLLEQQMQGLSEADAHVKMEREYIAQHETLARRHSSSYVARHQSADGNDHNFTQHHIDLSPQAIEDFNRVMQQRMEEKSQKSDVYKIFTRYSIPYDHTLARTVVREAWEKEVRRLTTEDGMFRGPAERKANAEYLNNNTRIIYLQLGKNLSPRAFNDIENALLHVSIERERAVRI